MVALASNPPNSWWLKVAKSREGSSERALTSLISTVLLFIFTHVNTNFLRGLVPPDRLCGTCFHSRIFNDFSSHHNASC